MKQRIAHFGSAQKYRNWIAWGHIHGAFKHHTSKTGERIVIHGKPHKVVHAR